MQGPTRQFFLISKNKTELLQNVFGRRITLFHISEQLREIQL